MLRAKGARLGTIRQVYACKNVETRHIGRSVHRKWSNPMLRKCKQGEIIDMVKGIANGVHIIGKYARKSKVEEKTSFDPRKGSM